MTRIGMILGITFAAILQLRSQGYIVPNGVTSTFAGDSFILHVIQNPTNGNYTGFLLHPQGANSFLFDPFVDEGVRTFFVSPNQPLSAQAILAQSYPELTNPNAYVFADGSPFYVGLYTGDSFPQNGVYNDPLFGWARLVNNQGVIQMLDSALEYKGGGIYAGTQNIIPVPEPGGLALAVLGVLLLGFRRWENSMQRN